jgi:outer membrane protein OmpA-like peptidoglycan-associated protein
MMKASRQFALSVAILLIVQISAAAQQNDKEGCKDSPLITRFPGSVITSCKDMPDDSFVFEMGNKPKKTIEGEFHRLTYNFPKTASKAQVVRNLNTALRTAGYTFDYDSGDYGDFTVHLGKTWIQIEISVSGNYAQTIVIETQLTQDVVADAAALTTGLNSNGHMVVNGILFDTGKSEVKPESGPALEEVVKLLKQDPKMKLYVVGHTDNVGALPGNIDLSRARAAAVVQVLTSKYGITADRLQPYGNGPYAPLTSNDTEAGRTLNRRVELVKQ